MLDLKFLKKIGIELKLTDGILAFGHRNNE